jgi:hypothetical protein
MEFARRDVIKKTASRISSIIDRPMGAVRALKATNPHSFPWVTTLLFRKASKVPVRAATVRKRRFLSAPSQSRLCLITPLFTASCGL